MDNLRIQCLQPGGGRRLLATAFCAAALWTAGAAAALPLIELTAPGGDLKAVPGDTVGWGVTVQAQPQEWLSFIGSALVAESVPGAGSYTDLIGLAGGPMGGVLPAGGAAWQLPYDGLTQGLGQYTLAADAVPGTLNQATLRVLFERYSDNPFTCGSCFIDVGQADLAVSVRVLTPPVPEPATVAMWLGGLGVLLIGRASRLGGRQARRRP